MTDVDYRNDEGTRRRQAGTLIGPMPLPGQQAVAPTPLSVGAYGSSRTAAAACTPPDCSFDIECDDGDPCTTDTCNITPGNGACTGTCANAMVMDGESGGCDDGIYCNGRETCLGGVCTAGAPAVCCSDPLSPTVCADAFPRCDYGSQNAGVGCQTSSDCKDGLCEHCQDTCLIDADCADGRECNGVETCESTCFGGPTPGIICTADAICGQDGKCLGQCQPGINPCGAGARCSDKRCGTEFNFEECLYDSDCPVGETCNERPGPGYVCFLGRCCEPGANPAAELPCSYKNLAQCDAVAPIGGRQALWYAMDGGEQLLTILCGGQVPNLLDAWGWGCPKYTSGITQLNKDNPPVYPVIIGPISDSAIAVPAPGGPGAALNAIGDDYTLFDEAVCVGGPNSGNACTLDSHCPSGRCGSFLSMDALRYVGFSMGGGSRLSIDFYDAGGNFVEDVVTSGMAPEMGINVVSFSPPLIIPSSGWVVMRVASDFAPNMRFAMASTSAGLCLGGSTPGKACAVNADCSGGGTCLIGTAGGNNPNALWINTWPGMPIASVNNNFLKACDAGPKKNQACVVSGDCPNGACVAAPGILAFELVGDKVPDPVGGCCESGGGCVDGVVSWVCLAQGNFYLGDNQPCAKCNGGPNVGSACRTCLGGANAGAACNGNTDCDSYNCAPDTSKCPSTEYTCSTGYVGVDCNVCTNKTCNRVCSNKKCSGSPANTLCTGTGQGTCPNGQFCNFITCTTDTPCAPVGGGTCLAASTCTGAGQGTCPDGQSCLFIYCNGSDNTPCLAGGGTCQPNNSFCDLAGFCDLNMFICWTGNVGFACTSDNHCGIAGTCVPVSCEAAAVCGSGACCDSTTGNCTNVGDSGACAGAGGEWQGYGTECDADGGYDEAQQHCCRIPQYTDKRCMGGPNNLQACTVDDDCRFCVGGSHNGEACTLTSVAEPDGCLDVGVCDNGMCVGGLPPNPNTCTVDAQCPDNSGVCRGRCVDRGTGGDSCEDAYIHVITVPDLGEAPKTITISGNNNPATTSDDEPDTCRMGTDPGWWEGFAIDQCARVRVDLCCSDPIHQPQWNLLVGGCPDQCGSILGKADPYIVGQYQFGRGEPYCQDDNQWMTFGPLGAGTYWYPIYSELTGSHGDYQVHFTFEGCPTVACCLQECSGGPNAGNHCDKDATCPGGTCQGGTNAGAPCTKHHDCNAGNCSVTCVSQCEELNLVDCDARGGFSLAPPNIAPAIPTCMEWTCESGSCCTGPGQCLDQISEEDGNLMTSVICDEPGFNGNFVGGVRCKGGTCVGGPDDGESCDLLTEGQCAPPGDCQGTAQELAQPSPCPVCMMEGSDNCQRFENADEFSPSDLSAGSGSVWADDFVLTAPGTLESVCVWGVYLVPTEVPAVFESDCGGPELPLESQRADAFRVRVYEDDGGKPGGGNCTTAPFQRCFTNSQCSPGGLCLSQPLGESACTRTKALVTGAATAADLFRMWAFQLSLTTPITGLAAGKCYWLEVTNDNTDSVPEGCTWHWSQLLNTSTQGNQYSAAGSETNGYVEGSQRAWDMAWCLNLSVVPGGCASQNRACCSCTGSCTLTSLNACDDQSMDWHENDSSCPPTAGCTPPPNDACGDAQEVPVGMYSVSTQCATTDGGNPTLLPENDTDVLRDVWFYYRPTTNCPLRVDTCTSSQDQYFDSVVVIYHNDASPTTCVCPLNVTDDHAWFKTGSDDGCVSNGRAAGGIATLDVVAGNCYTIRVGGFQGNDEGGRTAADISCGPAVCGDGRRNGVEQCDGLDHANCFTATPSTYCLPDCTCGAPNPCGNGELDAGEECDAGSPSAPCVAPSTCRQAGDPKQCTCVPYCGNGNIEEGEECDGAAPEVGHSCPGRCQGDCKCPPLVCGNGRLEELAWEECEFGLCVGGNNNGQPCESDTQCALPGTCDETLDRLDCPVGACRTRNDPHGGCRCACGCQCVLNMVVWDPSLNPTPWPNNNPLATTRSLRFTVTGEAGPTTLEAIEVTMVDLQHPRPANLAAQPPPNFTTYDTRINGVCVGGMLAVHHCDADADCPPEIVAGRCSSLVGCTAPGETNGCARWVGKPGTFLESQDSPGGANYRASRLQCTPFYWDWVTETASEPIAVVGAEIVPSSEYSLQTYAASCMGAEEGCSAVSLPVTMYTRSSGDVAPNFHPPSTTLGPDAIDVAAVVNKLKNLPGALVKAIIQLQPNVPELNADINALDIVAVVDAVKHKAYAFGGPCPCPSEVTCGSTACTSPTPCVTAFGAGAMCVKSCGGGDNAGDPCVNDAHCPDSTCGAGFCRDRCGRCRL